MGKYLVVETKAVPEACQSYALKFTIRGTKWCWNVIGQLDPFNSPINSWVGVDWKLVFVQVFKFWWHSLRLVDNANKQKPVSDWDSLDTSSYSVDCTCS